MKKILALTLAMVMALSLAACGGTPNQPRDNGTLPADNQKIGGVDNTSDTETAQGFDAYLGEYRVSIPKYMGVYANYDSYVKITKDGIGYSMEVNSIDTGFEEPLFPVGSYTGTLEVTESGDNNYRGAFTANGAAIEISFSKSVVCTSFGGGSGDIFIQNNEPPKGKKWYSEIVGEFANSYPEPTEQQKAQSVTIGKDGSVSISFLNAAGEQETGISKLTDALTPNGEIKFDITTNKGNTYTAYLYPSIQWQKFEGEGATENSRYQPDVWYDAFKLYVMENSENSTTVVDESFINKDGSRKQSSSVPSSSQSQSSSTAASESKDDGMSADGNIYGDKLQFAVDTTITEQDIKLLKATTEDYCTSVAVVEGLEELIITSFDKDGKVVNIDIRSQCENADKTKECFDGTYYDYIDNSLKKAIDNYVYISGFKDGLSKSDYLGFAKSGENGAYYFSKN